MPAYSLTSTWSDPIPVQAGDVVQNTGRGLILVCPTDPALDDDAVEIEPNNGFTITAATAVTARSASRHGGRVKVIRGL